MSIVTTQATMDPSPYTPQTLDAAIAHLERVLRSEVTVSLFPETYWRDRVQQAFATAGLVQRQQQRLSRLLDLLPPASNVVVSKKLAA